MESRLKTEESIQNKLIRKGYNNNPKKSVDELIRDVAGVRCVCYDINQVYKFVKVLKKDEELEIVKQKDYIESIGTVLTDTILSKEVAGQNRPDDTLFSALFADCG